MVFPLGVGTPIWPCGLALVQSLVVQTSFASFRAVSQKSSVVGPKPMKMRSCLAIAAIVMAFAFFAASRVFMGYSPVQTVTFFLAPSTDRMCDIGEPITEQLREYHKKHGVYPPSLDDAGIEALSTFFGPWEYQLRDDGASCELSNGDYGRYLFIVSWTPGHGWNVDT